MRYFIDKQAKESAYMQLYRQIRRDIVDGVYPEKSKLPSKRTLSLDLGVSVITVQHAYDILCDEGYAEPKERSGYFVIYRSSGFFSSPDEKMPEKMPSIHSVKGIFPFSVLAKSMRKTISEYGERILIKSPDNGTKELREALCDYLHRSRGIKVKSSQIVIGSGAEYLYGLIVQLIGSDKIYALEDPSYEKIRRVYGSHGVKLEFLKMGLEGIRTDELERSAAGVLHVTPYNSFPSGITASASKRREYIEWAKKRGAYIVEDDFDSEFSLSSKSEDTLFSLEPEKTVIYVNTFSKTIAPSFRIGYMVLPDALCSEYSKKLSFYSCTVPVFEQYVLSDLLRGGDFERHINRVRRQRRKNG